MATINSNRAKEIGTSVLFFFIGFFLWEIFILIIAPSSLFLPRPSKIILEFLNNFQLFWKNLILSMLPAIIGYFIATLLSFILAIVFIHSKILEMIFYPYILALRITPILVMIPFIVLFFGIGIIPKIIIVILFCFFPLLINTVKGLKAIDENKLELLKSFSANKWQILFKLRLPNSLPFVFPALKTSSTFALTGVFVAEFLSADRGIGYLIILNIQFFNLNAALAATFMVISAGIFFFLLIDFAEKRVVFWQKQEKIQ